MGTGNFDNENALTYVGDFVQQFAETIEDILSDEQRSRLDQEGESALMPNVELIALLCERYDVPPPKPKVVDKWRLRYLRIYDKQIDEAAATPEFKRERRREIEKTFAWLGSIAHAFHDS